MYPTELSVVSQHTSPSRILVKILGCQEESMIINAWITKWYCWWLKSYTTWDEWNPINNGINYLSTGVRFQPSTVLCIIQVLPSDPFRGFKWPCQGFSLTSIWVVERSRLEEAGLYEQYTHWHTDSKTLISQHHHFTRIHCVNGCFLWSDSSWGAKPLSLQREHGNGVHIHRKTLRTPPQLGKSANASTTTGWIYNCMVYLYVPVPGSINSLYWGWETSNLKNRESLFHGPYKPLVILGWWVYQRKNMEIMGVERNPIALLLLMAEILHHLGCIEPCK